jgi:hypothetical protein
MFLEQKKKQLRPQTLDELCRPWIKTCFYDAQRILLLEMR